ncbi:MAG: SDR family NAD(P)-dependent oxidoreductase, partial [Proteobacteria bacterium]|nr:SDR family NAD(P)-dependent oxidoreductase [Pseudomonadota bacterium]
MVTTSGLQSTLALVQALEDGADTAPLWLLTRGAVCTGEDDPVDHPRQGLLWGLGRVVGLEMPHRWGGLIDLPETLDRQMAAAVVASLGCDDHEDQVAVRPTGRHVRRLVPSTPSWEQPWTPRGTVLVTGGTGALGGHVARWLAERGAEHLVLTSRRGPDAPGAEATKQSLASLGVRVSVVACDVSQRSAVHELVDTLLADSCPLTAVVHAAGIGTFCPLGELSVSGLEADLAGKVGGAWHLHERLSGHPLDAFVLFGSIAGLWGSGGQAGYSAANAGLTALAHHRRGRGLPATVLHWGAWADERGMADAEAMRQLRRRGVLPVAPEGFLAALD